jgi:hypothetical protein
MAHPCVEWAKKELQARRRLAACGSRKKCRTPNLDWSHFLAALALVLVRVSGMVAFAPFLLVDGASAAHQGGVRGRVAYLLAPLVAALPLAQVSLSYSRCWESWRWAWCMG